MSTKIGLIEERRSKKADASDDEEASSDGGDKFKAKRLKNIDKIVKYHQRKRRDFKQHEPILDEPYKRQQTE